MKKLKIGRNSFIYIRKTSGTISYRKWVEYIEQNREYFIWYENTTKGQTIQKKVDEFSEDIRPAILYMLNKSNVYCTNKLSKNYWDCVVTYINSGELSVSLEKRISKKIAAKLLEMAEYLDAKIVIDEKYLFESVDQLTW
ncbi:MULTISPECIES: hypothetical protein [environmental samples]|mgnify:CR=1 FL=1|uniref:hypothetical protein n=1 Tax=environmental samples TaxID=134245 RepID=UPI00033CEEEC|nr:MULTISPECIES: hypothetical protein [environmental samples]CCY09092.1 uncharacterized protein BN460_00666 [Porphyromonas sp. CAG:1061]